MVDSFLQGLKCSKTAKINSCVPDSDRSILRISPQKVSKAGNAPFSSPSKKSPEKENSPLKKMGSLRKESRMAAEQEKPQSPLKVFGKSMTTSSPEKRAISKMFKASSANDCSLLDSLKISPEKTCPLENKASDSP